MKLGFYTPEEEIIFTKLIDEMATLSLEHSLRAISELEMKKDGDIDDVTADAINLAISEVAVDKVVELSKDWPRELMIKIIANLAGSQAIGMMNKQPEYMMKIAMEAMIKKPRK